MNLKISKRDTYASLAYQLDLENDSAESVFIAALDIAKEHGQISALQHWKLSNENGLRGRKGRKARQLFAEELELASGPVSLDTRYISSISRHATRISNETGLDIDKILDSISKVINWIIENEDQIKKLIETIMRLVALVGA